MQIAGLARHSIKLKYIDYLLSSLALINGQCISPDLGNTLHALPVQATIPDRNFDTKARVFLKLARSTRQLKQLRIDLDSWDYVQQLCKELEEILSDATLPPSRPLNIVILGGQLILYIMQVERAAKHAKSSTYMLPELGGQRQHTEFIMIASMTAAKLVFEFSEMCNNSIAGGTGDKSAPQRHLPKHYFGILLVAMAFILKLKVLRPPEWRFGMDQENTHISIAHQILSSWSRDKLDEAGRATRLIEVILYSEAESRSKMDQRNLGDRPGVAVLDDIIAVAKEIREQKDQTTRNSENSRPTVELSTSTWSNDELFLSQASEQLFLEWNLPWEMDFFKPGDSSAGLDDVVGTH